MHPLHEDPSEMPTEYTDPVCGMKVDPVRAAAKGTYAGQTIYFCSVGCKAAFDRTHTPSG
jgi:YHS domain-containing protein